MSNKIDEPMMRLLGENASQSSDALARQLRVSAATVRRRIRKLAKEDILRIVAVVDPDKVGLPVAALLSLEVPQDKLEEVSDSLVSLPEVKWVSTTTGKTNLMAFVRASSNEGLSSFLDKQLTKLDGVRGCETQVCLDVKKGRFVHI